MKHLHIKMFVMLACMTLGSVVAANAQVSRQLRTESNGFKWYNTSQGGYEGAEALDGTVLIPLSRRYTFICFHPYDGHFGYFGVERGNLKGACDVDGREIIEPYPYISLFYTFDGFNYKDEQGHYIPMGILLDATGHVQGGSRTTSSSGSGLNSKSGSKSDEQRRIQQGSQGGAERQIDKEGLKGVLNR